MALCHVQFRAESIRKDTGMYVLLPNGRGPFPVLYLLHGISDDYTRWCRSTSLERYARPLPLIIVTPDGQRSMYVNDPRPGGLAYEDHIVKDVVGFVERTFPVIRGRTARAIAGLSMGGYGAMMLSMRHPEMFSVACSHSGALFFTHKQSTRKAGLKTIVDAVGQRKYNCFALARKLKRTRRRIAIRLDCGTEDGLIECNRDFHAHLDKLGITHEYTEHPGAHNWDYWDAHIPDTLAFVMKHLCAARK